jgi:hypothetical protein
MPVIPVQLVYQAMVLKVKKILVENNENLFLLYFEGARGDPGI